MSSFRGCNCWQCGRALRQEVLLQQLLLQGHLQRLHRPCCNYNKGRNPRARPRPAPGSAAAAAAAPAPSAAPPMSSFRGCNCWQCGRALRQEVLLQQLLLQGHLQRLRRPCCNYNKGRNPRARPRPAPGSAAAAAAASEPCAARAPPPGRAPQHGSRGSFRYQGDLGSQYVALDSAPCLDFELLLQHLPLQGCLGRLRHMRHTTLERRGSTGRRKREQAACRPQELQLNSLLQHRLQRLACYGRH